MKQYVVILATVFVACAFAIPAQRDEKLFTVVASVETNPVPSFGDARWEEVEITPLNSFTNMSYKLTAHGVRALADAATFYRALLPAGKPRTARG